VAEPSDESNETNCSNSLPLTGEGIVIDIGTGDGVFVYQCAQENPRKFYIGIDANARPLEKVSEKIHRKPDRGGLPNVLFLQSAIEDLPLELDGVADEVHVHFPWGSLLRVVAMGDERGLDNLRRVCSTGALLEVVIGLDPDRDRSEIERLGLQHLSPEHIEHNLRPAYQAAGFDILESGVLTGAEWHGVKTSWARKLRGNEGRTVSYLVAEAIKPEECAD
jgi:16S rRNA (adenine(1408)-N(1))-methyltransferase